MTQLDKDISNMEQQSSTAHLSILGYHPGQALLYLVRSLSVDVNLEGRKRQRKKAAPPLEHSLILYRFCLLLSFCCLEDVSVNYSSWVTVMMY